ncbi:MAG: hypothetical protein H7096_05010 [Flavobacterium sp.]|nr:hypothetical protein [Pedobacter sp.]
MRSNNSIRFKAIFLLTVFMMNIGVVFACALGINMGYNKTHHSEKQSDLTHKHDKPEQQKNAEVNYSHGMGNPHDSEITDYHRSKKSKDDCCTDEAEQFAKMDKMAPKSIDFNLQPVLVVAYFSSFYNFNVFATSESIFWSKYFVRGHHPPIQEIRIAIQSFLI